MARRPRLLAQGLLYHVIAAIQAYIQYHNRYSKPFVWTAKAEDIIAKYQGLTGRTKGDRTVFQLPFCRPWSVV